MDCAVRVGFFILRDCGAAAAETCTVCARACCAQHVRRGEAALACVECYHRQPGRESSSAAATEDAWTYAFRHEYYRSCGYHPFYVGHRTDPYYDAYDVRAFQTESGDTDLDDEPGGFGDS